MPSLKAQRYNHNPQLAEFIENELHYLDFEQAIDFYKEFTDKTKNLDDLAFLACNDRFFLLAHMLNRHDIVHPWLYDRCREVEANPDGWLDLWARYHYKSTIITFAGVIQEILIDPELTVAIFSHTQPIAKAFLEQIKRELEANGKLKEVFDDVLFANPQAESPRWSAEGIIVKRLSNPREATVEAHGLVDGQPISRHYSLLVYDDVVTEKSVTNPDQITKTTRMWELSDNLSTHLGARKWHAGTRYHHGDTYGIILERKALRERRYAATDDGTLKGNPIFLSQKRWNEVKTAQKSTVAAQMLLNPTAGNEQIFLSEWFSGYETVPAMMNVYILCDPSKGKKKHSTRSGSESDNTAIAVIGIDQGGNKYLLDGYCHRMKLSTRYSFIKELHKKWSSFPGVQVVKVGYEQYGQQVDLEVLEEYMERDRVYFEIEELNFPREGLHSKKHRVERLEPDVKTGRFRMPALVHHPDMVPPAMENNPIPAIDRQIGITPGTVYWSAWTQEDYDAWAAAGKANNPAVGQIMYRPLRGLTKAQRWMKDTQQSHRIVTPLRRLDEDGNIYDLTRVFMEEARFFPFAPHDDLIDAVSRIYDIEPCSPVAFESIMTEASQEDQYGVPGGDD
jgi:hypothetical protein